MILNPFHNDSMKENPMLRETTSGVVFEAESTIHELLLVSIALDLPKSFWMLVDFFLDLLREIMWSKSKVFMRNNQDLVGEF